MRRHENTRQELALAALVGLVAGYLLVTVEWLAPVLLWTLAGTGALIGVLILVNTATYARRRPQVTPAHPERRRVL